MLFGVGNLSAKEVVFIDKGISDYEVITKELNKDYHLLDKSQNGLIQISNILKNQKDIDSIHIISHGNSGELLLGNSKINSTNLNNYLHELNTIKTSLKDSGDILLYGCNVASGEKGKSFIDSFATLSGADIGASTNLTGNDKLGGDWKLEANLGEIKSTHLNINTFDGVLIQNEYVVPPTGSATLLNQSLWTKTVHEVQFVPIQQILLTSLILMPLYLGMR